MIRKPRMDAELVASVKIDLSKKVSRAYQLLFIAWLIATFGVKLDKIPLLGVPIVLEKPDVAVGLLLLFVVLIYLYVFVKLLADSPHLIATDFGSWRARFFNALSKYKIKSLSNPGKLDLDGVRKLTRRFYWFSVGVYAIQLLFPLLIAVYFSGYIFDAVKFLFGF